MKKIPLILLFLFSINKFATAQTWQDTVRIIDQLFERYAPENPGCQIAISKNGQICYSRVFGMADLDKHTKLSTSSLIEAGSVSKQFTAAAILLLEQQGKLSLDDDIHKHLPELPDYGIKISLRQMVHHTSGLKDCWALLSLSDWPRGSKVYNNQQILDLMAHQRSLNHAPEEEFLYSNSNYILLAIIVERLSAKSLAQFTEEYIFKPAGMTHSRWRTNSKQIIPGRAMAYANVNGKYVIDMPNEEVYGNGGLLTTAEDLNRWNLFYSHNLLGRPGLLQKQLDTIALNNGSPNPYAAGIRLVTLLGHRVWIHDGATAAYRASLEFYPDQDLSIAWLANTSSYDDKPDELSELRKLLLTGERPDLPQSKPGTDADHLKLELYTGNYHSDEVDGNLKVLLNEAQLEIHRAKDQKFKLAAGAGEDFFQIVDSKVTVHFLRNAKGKITGLHFNTPRVRKVLFEKLK
ncbi:serine hydrolase [Pedobacter sp. V48]|uniref:serine hydrolase domain-containing protein n=1 Tax=Pedobacter sp. V48 TaxID=509635 RepID=UPI0003E5836D|nr:serine hydrolase domain-containing protein [Pedobacter sp. V48]ETZ20179.1 hypothetical protein N824_08175 [Pedobacter sp. V48]